MKKIKQLLSISVLLSLLLLTSLSFSLPKGLASDQEAETVSLVFPEDNIKVVSIKKSEKNQQANYQIILRYPQLSGTNLSNGAQGFNHIIQMVIKDQTSQFTKSLQENLANKNLFPKANSYLKIDYDNLQSFMSASLKTNYISVLFKINSFQLGMAHPYQENISINYELSQNKKLELEDLFKPNFNYLSFLANSSRSMLKNKNIPFDMLTAGTAPKIENFKNWNLTLKGLLITFDEAQVAPRYYGQQQVLIPNAELKSVLSHSAACTLGIIRCDAT